MKTTTQIFTLAVIYFAITGCTEAKAPLDETPVVKVDKNLLGVWMQAGKSNTNNFVLVQTYPDLTKQFAKLLKTTAYGMDVSGSLYVDEIYLQEQAKCDRDSDYYYFITVKEGVMNELKSYQMLVFSSFVKNTTFLNIADVHSGADSAHKPPQYLLLRILRINPKQDTITYSEFTGDSLKTLENCSSVRAYVERNIDNPSCYTDTQCIYKISKYHATFKGAAQRAH